MASFPTSARTFASLSNGQTIQATDVGDVRDEVAAIEDGYLNGTARLNSSNSTMVALSVTGGSTIAGPLTVGGATTLSSAVTINGAVTFGSSGTIALPRATRAQVSASGTIAVADSAWVGISFDTENSDPDGLHSTTTNSSRINLTSSGVWVFKAQTEWNGGVVGAIKSRLVINDTDVIAAAGQPNDGTGPQIAPVSGEYIATSTTAYVTLRVLQVSGSTRSIAPSTTYGGTFFIARKVSG